MQKKEINKKIELIQKKLTEKKEENNEKYGVLLKRRRLELQRTLEDVASGVCSTSYLSRIENAQVEVKDYFLKNLFDKLEISYDDIKTLENKKIIDDVLKKYLLDDYDAIHEMVNNSIKSTAYSDIELKLLLLFVNIVDNLYEDARVCIADLDLIVDSLVGKELVFFTFLSTLFAYKCNNFEIAYKYVRILRGINYTDSILGVAITDLAMSIYASLDEEALVKDCFEEIQEKNIAKISLKRYTKHLIELYYINGIYDLNKAIENFSDIKENMFLDEELLEHYNYYFIKMYLQNNHFNEGIEIIKKVKRSSRIINLFDYCLNVMHDMHEIYKNIDLLKEHCFNKYESYYMFYNEFTLKRFENNDLNEAVNYLKKNLINEALAFKKSFVYQIINYTYLNALYELGKYKEAAKYSLRLFVDNEEKQYKISKEK